MTTYQIQATFTVEREDGSRSSQQIPTFYVDAGSAKSALRKAQQIIDAHELGEIHATAYDEESGDYAEV